MRAEGEHKFSKTTARKRKFTVGVKVLKNKSTGRFDCE